jgi:hypothetical protein
MSALATPKTNAQRAIAKHMWSQKANKTFVEHLVKLVALVTEVLSATPSTIGCVEDSSSVQVLDFYKDVVLGTITLRCNPGEDNLVANLDNFVKQQVDTAAYEAYRTHFTDIPDYDITTYRYEDFIRASAVLTLLWPRLPSINLLRKPVWKIILKSSTSFALRQMQLSSALKTLRTTTSLKYSKHVTTRSTTSGAFTSIQLGQPMTSARHGLSTIK